MRRLWREFAVDDAVWLWEYACVEPRFVNLVAIVVVMYVLLSIIMGTQREKKPCGGGGNGVEVPELLFGGSEHDARVRKMSAPNCGV